MDYIILPPLDYTSKILDPREGDGGDSDGENKYNNHHVFDIMISNWMGYFLLQYYIIDSLVRSHYILFKVKTFLTVPGHSIMYLATITNEQDHNAGAYNYASAMGYWDYFVESTLVTYRVDMLVLDSKFNVYQRWYYILYYHWCGMHPDQVLTLEPKEIKRLGVLTCTLENKKGLSMYKEV